jgi:hypothetical protein
MAGRGQQTFNKRQKEQQRKERQQEKIANRIQRKKEGGLSAQLGPEDEDNFDGLGLDELGVQANPPDQDSAAPSSPSPNNHQA